jgi:hypothetical protein
MTYKHYYGGKKTITNARNIGQRSITLSQEIQTSAKAGDFEVSIFSKEFSFAQLIIPVTSTTLTID